MLKKTLLAAAALSFMALAASPAYATYGYNHRYNYSWYNGYPSYKYKSYVYQPSCHYETRPVTIKVWDDYSYRYYFKTIYRKIKVCY